MSPQQQSIHRLAVALGAGPMDSAASLKERVKPIVGDLRKARWLDPLIVKLSGEFGLSPRPTWRQIADRIREERAFQMAWRKGRVEIGNAIIDSAMAPAPGAPQSWKVPAITTLHDLAATLRLHADDLGWLTAPGQCAHYLHRWHRKPKSDRSRLIEIPKPLLKLAQRSILQRILEEIPPHEAAQGFRRGRSVRDFVASHTAKELVLRMDLEEFFPSIAAPRVLRLFLTAGYPEAVSRALTTLCTHSVPAPVLGERNLNPEEARRLSSPHLPQGAPTSPALANLSAFRFDCRLAGLAKAAGANYTRYADDLLFSGGPDFARQARRFENMVSALALEEGFRPNHRKTRHLRPAQRQSAAGLVLNEKPNVNRHEYDRLKAILTNCVRLGPTSQNRENRPEFRAHLQGRIAWINFINPARGAKLVPIFANIRWEGD